MKKYILLLLLCLPIALGAQVQSKYLEGAVPVVDGKVTFSQELGAKGFSKEQLYGMLLDWANDHLIFDCKDNTCDLTMTRITYLYEESRTDGGYKYKAEEWITDKHGLNKSKDKLAKISGKFRKETIDYKDKLFTEVQTFLNSQIVNSLNNAPTETPAPVKVEAKAEPVKQVTAEPKATLVEPTTTVVAVPNPAAKPQENIQESNIEELVSKANRMTITAGKEEQFEIGKEAWGGFGEMFSKKVAFCLLDTQKKMGNMLMNQLQEYTISFYSDDSKTPIAVIQCKKMMQQSLKGKEAKLINPSCDDSKSYNLYVGEIVE